MAVIGIDSYASWPALRNAVSDARGAFDLFTRLGFEAAVPPLIDRAATGEAIRRLVTDDLAELGTEDNLVVFFAGHGFTRRRALADAVVDTGYMIPADGDPSTGLAATWIRLDSWLSDVARLPAKHILVILDACYSGIALDTVIRYRDGGLRSLEPLAELRARQSRRIITSALADQRALDNGPVRGHSLFTGCLIEALTGGLAGAGRLEITTSELGHYIQRRVSEYPGARQTPDFGALELDNRGELVLPLAPAARQPAGCGATSPSPPPPPAELPRLADALIVTTLEEARDALLSKLAWVRQDRRAEDGHNTYYAATLPTLRGDGLEYDLRLTCLVETEDIGVAPRVQDALRRWRPQHLIFVGTAASVAEEVALGDVLVANPGLQPDGLLLDACANYATGWADLVTVERPGPGAPVRWIGPLASLDEASVSKRQLRRLRASIPNLLAVEGTAGGAAAAIWPEADARCLAIRGISSLAGASADPAVSRRWRGYACDVAAAYTIGMLRGGPLAVGVLGEPIPLAAGLRTALELTREAALARGQKIRTPHLLRAVISLPRVGRLFEQAVPGEASRIERSLDEYLRALPPEPVVEATHWNQQQELRRARELAGTAAPVVDEVSLLRALLESSSRTIAKLRDRLGEGFGRLERLVQQAVDDSAGTPGPSGLFGGQ